MLLISLVFIALGCATPYQSVGFTGGYEETRLDENIYNVYFRGNGYTSRQKAEDFALLRAAELTLQSGYKFFVITASNAYTSTSFYTTPVQSKTKTNVSVYGNTVYGKSKTTTTGGDTYAINKPGVALTIVCFKERPETNATIFNAQFIDESIKSKYKIEQTKPFAY